MRAYNRSRFQVNECSCMMVVSQTVNKDGNKPNSPHQHATYLYCHLSNKAGAGYFCLCVYYFLIIEQEKSRTQLQDSSSKFMNKIMFHPSSELITGCPSEHISNISCQHSVTPFSLMHLLFICLTFSVSTLHQDSSTSPLAQEFYAFRS